MATQHLYSKIKELGDVYNRRDDLRTFCKLHFEEIMNSFSRRILNSDGAEVLNGLFNGLSESLTSVQKLKVKVADTVLQVMRQESTSTTHCRNITSRLCLELPRIPVETLVKWCGDSVQSIIADKDVNMIWRDVLPECLNTLSSYDTVQHCGTEMTTTEYQQQCIHTLLQCKWKEEQLVQLATMFKEIQLPREEHKQVVNKLCSYTIDITPDALPPLVHQLLKLCKVYNMEIVLVHLSHYFNIHLYSKLEPPPQDSESTTMDIDDIVQHSTTELSRCLSTCIYHISQGAADPELIRKHIKLWPKSQLLRSPFMIDLALALSDKGTDFRTVCLDAIRSSIEMRVLDELRSLESASARVVIPPDIHVTTVLKVITADSANHRELTVPGLIHLAFSLLSTARSRPASTTCWSHGKLILVRLSKAQPETAAHILSQLNDKLVSDLQPQFSDCLYILCKLTPVSIERCSQLSTILECTQPRGDWRLPASVYNAVHPLVNFSSRTRDTLLMICRKGLYSRDSNYRCLALSGFLTILQFIKLSKNTFSSSQSNSEQYSTHSYLTQMTVDLHATQQGAVVTSRVRNEATCMEVVSILRRCLLHDADVKQLLYSNIYECAKEKPILHESILELLYEHLVKYLPEDNEETIQLKFDKCVQVTATNAVLLEPIGYLIYCISQFLQSADNEELEDILSSQDVDTSSTHLKNKLNSVLSKLCGSDELAHVDLDEVGLTDLTPESKCKAIKVQQMLLCYEALIAHLVTQWSLTTTQANDVYKLYKCYNQLLEQTKTPSKQSKKNAKSLNDTRESTKSQKTQKSQPDKGKGPMKLSNLVKDRAGPFKPLPSVWNLRTCLRIMELLYSEEVPWSTTEQRNQIRTRRDFHHFVLRAVLAVLSNEHLEKRMVATYVVKIANLLFHRYICRFQSMCDFDDQTALSCMDVFKQCLTVVMSLKYSLKLDVVMQNITGLSESSSPDCIAAILEQILVALAQIEADNLEEERDLLVKRLYNALIQTAAMLLEVHVPASTSIHEVIIKLEEYMSSSKLDCIPLLQSLLAAGAREQLETKLLDEVLEKLTQLLPRATDEEDIAEESSQYPCINSKSCHTVLAIVCAHITHRCKSIEHLLNRCQCMVPPAFASEGQKMKIEKERSGIYKSIMIQLCQCVSWWSVGGGLRCAVGGAGSDKLLLLAVRLYQLLGLYAKRIAPEDAATVRFDRLLKISGKKFSSVIDDLIMYLEATQQQDSASKVLRDTKLIPRVVLAGEQFSKNVMLLAAKAKINFQQYLSLGTARDFRIKAPVLEQVLQARGQPDNDEEDNINDATTEVLSQDNEDNQSPRKRRRIS